MREIKFRAWDKERKMLYDVRHLCFWSGKSPTTDARRHDELMQYTGLKDKNGKEIYEGDIVRRNERNVVVDYIRVFRDQPFAWKLRAADNSGWVSLSYPNTLEIIGNIYENPLEGGET